MHPRALDLIAARAGKTEAEVRSLLTDRREWRSTFVASSPAAAVEDRAAGEDDAPKEPKPHEMRLEGYSAVFDSDSVVLFGFLREQIKRGAFKNVLRRGPDVRLLENHQGRPHARTTNGTLELEEKPRGLFRNALLDPNRQDSRDLYHAVLRGDYTQSSFAFTVARDEWRYCDHVEEEGPQYAGCDCIWERDILEIGELFDDSVVTYPAYPDTTATVARSEDAPLATRADDADTGVTVARESGPTGERHAPASDEEQRDTAPDSDASTTRTGSDPTSQRQRRVRVARIKGNRNEPGNHGGAR